LSEGEVSSDAVVVGKFMVPWSSRITRPDGVCKSCGSGLLGSGVVVVVIDVQMSFEMWTGVTEGHDCVDIFSFRVLIVFVLYRWQ
jgi:hypothetical protein